MWRSSPAKRLDERAAIARARRARAPRGRARPPSPRCARRAARRRRGSSSSPTAAREQLLGLGLVEAQLGGAQLEQLAVRAQARERQRRIVPGRDRQLECRRQMVEQERDARVHVLALDQVVVIEHEHEPRVERGELVDQRRQHDLDRIGAAHAERGERRRRRRPARRARSASIAYAQKRTGSLSVRSIVNHAKARVSLGSAAHSASTRRLAPARGSVEQRQAPRLRGDESLDEQLARRRASAPRPVRSASSRAGCRRGTRPRKTSWRQRCGCPPQAARGFEYRDVTDWRRASRKRHESHRRSSGQAEFDPPP